MGKINGQRMKTFVYGCAWRVHCKYILLFSRISQEIMEVSSQNFGRSHL